MTRSSKHKSHKQSKHSSRDYSDSDEDMTKVKEKNSKEDNYVRGHRDSASGDKRKISFQVRDGKDSKDNSHGNGDAAGEYVSSKRRKEKADVTVGGDRWNGGGDGDRNLDKEIKKDEILKIDSKVKEIGSKCENLKIESKSKSKRQDSGIAGKKEDGLSSVVVDREESKSKSESKRKSERDSSSRKEGKELKEKDLRLEKEKNGDTVKKYAFMDAQKNQGSQLGDFGEEKQDKRARENSDHTLLDDSQNPEFEKDTEKRMRRKRDGSGEKEKYHGDYKEGDERRSSVKGDRAKDLKYRDDKHKDGSYADKYQEDVHKDGRRRDENYREEADKDYKHQDGKHHEEGEKDAKRRDDRHHGVGNRDSRHKDEKHHEDVEHDNRRKDEKTREGIEREGRRDDKYYEDGDRNTSRKDVRCREDGDKDFRCRDERYHDDGDKNGRRRDSSYRDDGDRDYKHKEEKYQDDTERDTKHKDSKQGDGFDTDKKARDIKYRDELSSRDRSGDKSDLKRYRDDRYSADHYSRKSSAYDDSPTRYDKNSRHRDDQGRRRINEKEDDVKSRGTKDQRSDAEKKTMSSARIDSTTDRGGSTSKNADAEHNSSYGRRRSSPTSNSHAPRDHHRTLKQDETKYRDYNYEERVRPSTRDYSGVGGGSEKATSSRSIEKHGQKDDGHFGELSGERRLRSDICSSPLQQVDKSPSSSTDRRQFNRSDVKQSIDFGIGDSTPRSGGSRDWKEYTGKDVRGSRGAGEEIIPADADPSSVSSPFARNSHFSSSSKSLAHPPSFRKGLESPYVTGSGEDDGRGKSNIRHRRMADPNMGRIQGNSWRGVPSWPSPVANGFLPFPHGPPPVGYHSVMHPFPAPPMFGVRPSMELNHPNAYHMPDADRFSGPVRPMGWPNQLDDSCPPMHTWDASNAVFGDESHRYGRSEWDHSRNLPVSRGWEGSGDFWKGPSRTECMELPSSDKENSYTRSGDDAGAGQSIHPTKNEQNQVNHVADVTDISQSTKSIQNNVAPLAIFEDTDNDSKMERKGDMKPYHHVYLSKLDISADLTEPELLNKCTVLIDMDQGLSSDVNDSKILYIEDIEANVVSHNFTGSALFGSHDDSVFQKSMSLYKRQKETILAEYGVDTLNEFIPDSNQENQNIEDYKTELLRPANGIDVGLDPKNDMQEAEEITVTAVVTTLTEKPENPVSCRLEITEEDGSSTLEAGPMEVDVEVKPARAAGNDVALEFAGKNEEAKLVDIKCVPSLNSDLLSSASEPFVPGSVNLSRIHHSPESTH